MKNFIISLITICLSFFITVTILKTSLTSTSADGIVAVDKSDEKVTVKTKVADEDKRRVEGSDGLDFSEIVDDFKSWKAYHKENIDLSLDFIPIDADGDEVTKDVFLEALTTGENVAIKLEEEEEIMYQLYEIDKKEDVKISKSIKSSSNVAYKYYLKEGTVFPEFSFKDLNENLYTTESTKGKIVVLKCWFIQCRVCVEEFPVINDLYDKYEGHDDILFLSLAFDKADKLKKFLSRKEFRYPVVPEQKGFMRKDMEVIQYPTHLIIGKDGKILKMVNNIDSLIIALDAMAGDESETDHNEA